MMDTNLKASLKSLHSSLATTGPIDEELQDLLRQLDGDIKQLLERRAEEAAAPDTTTYGLAERTQELSAKFAVKHPQLEPALRELGNILNSMGI
jgi:arsenate reductase-like glutaredoxin family protein